ncbi:MAG: aspartate kinase [Myxococcales bacterium]|nr:aspartate kinase [Myxococcales bacterium]
MTSQPLRVLKFGGSSVGAPERLVRVTDRIVAERGLGPLAVVVSAMGDTTDWLIDAARSAAAGDLPAATALVDRAARLAVDAADGALRELLRRPHDPLASARELPDPELADQIAEHLAPLRQVLAGICLLRQATPQSTDLVMSFGERLSAGVLTALLRARGEQAVYVDARGWCVTDDRFGAALVDAAATRARIDALAPAWRGRVAVHTGFLGATADGRTTTLGRNGSDYTAALLGNLLGAAEVQIWTDVPGVMTGDPAILRDAYPIAAMSYAEALELANFGARMFHPRTMVPLIESRIPMRIRSTMNPDAAGTRIDADGAAEAGPTSVTSLENLALLDVRWRRLGPDSGIGMRVLRALEQAAIPVWMANQAAHGQAVSVVVPRAEAERAVEAVERELQVEHARGEVEGPGVRAPVTLLSLVSERLGPRTTPAQFFRALGGVGVPIRAIAQGTGSRSISCVVDGEDTALAVRTVHAAFNFAHEEVHVLVLGHGVVGSELLAQIHQQRATLESRHQLRINVVGLADSRRLLFDEAGLDLANWRGRLAEAPARAASPRPQAADEPAPQGEPAGDPPDPLVALSPALDRLQRLAVPVLVDCTAADGMERIYQEAFRRGVHVVAANKRPLSGPADVLRDQARAHHVAYHYETTVGASLPVIATLADLVRTGDRIRRVEGSFSGSLGFITGEVMRGVPLSQAVRTARERGYTEPHPRDDLSGLDVARKALILARELGLRLDLEQIQVHPLVHHDLLAEPDLEYFFEDLADYDATFSASIADLRASGRVLRYLARIDLDPNRSSRPSGPDQGGESFRVRVGPIDVPPDHPAATLKGAEAFVAFTTERYEEYPLVVRGAGAGGAVTAAGVLADILKIGQTLRGR